jgi:hypothetical protein
MIFAVFALHIVVLLYYGVQLLDICKFFMSIIFFTLVPGLLVLSYCRVYEQDGYKFALAAAIGICLNIILYMVISILQVKFLFYLIFVIILLFFLRRRNLLSDLRLLITTVENIERCYINYLIFLSILFLGLVIAFLFIPNPLPGSNQALIYYIDQPWHLGNIAEIKNHWYPQDPRLAGYPFHYHIFSYIFTAFISTVSGIELPVLFFRLNTLFLLYLLFFASYFTGSRWFNRRSTGILNVITFFFLGTALLSYPFNIFLINFFTSPTFLLASIFTLFLIMEIKAYYNKGYISHLFLSLLLIIGMCGAKGSFFPVIFAGLLGCFGYSVLSRKLDKRLNILMVSSLLVFSMVFAYIFKSTGSEGINIVPLEIIRYTSLFEFYQSFFESPYQNWLIWSFVPVYFFAFFSFRALALINLIKTLLSSIRNIQFDKLFMAGVIIASFIPGYLLSYRERSEYFYLFVGYICLNYISAEYLYDVYRRNRSKLLKLIVIFLLLLSTTDTIISARQLHQIIPELKAVDYKPLTPSLYEGLTFLREHTDKDAIIASYRSFIYSDDNPRFFYYSAFSERRVVVEGWQYMSKERQEEAQRRHADMAMLYTTKDAELAANILDKYSVDYLILETAISQQLNFNGSQLLIPRFQNNEMEIYQRIKK